MKKKFNLFWIAVIALALSACGSGVSNSNGQEAEKEETEIANNPEQETHANEEAEADEGTEVHYQQGSIEGYKKALNSRFGFTLEIPLGWRAVNKSENNDGFYIESNNERTDIRAYGTQIQAGFDDLEAPPCNDPDVFTFTDGFDGNICKDGNEWYFYRSKDDVRITFYVKAPAPWLQDNKEVIQHMAKSLSFQEVPS